MRNELNQWTPTCGWRVRSIAPHRSSGMEAPTLAGSRKIRPRSDVLAAFLLAVVCPLWLGSATLPVQAVVNETTNASAAVVGASTNVPAISLEAPAGEAVSNAPAEVTLKAGLKLSKRKGRGHENPLVVFGKDAELKEDETADAVVVIGGNAVVRGKVREAAVVIGGNLEISGEVGEAAVAVMGNVQVLSNAVVHGNVVSVGGKVEVVEGATVEGETEAVDFAAIGLPHPAWLRNWFAHCAMTLRPLAPQVGWVWAVAGIFFLLYALVAAVLPRPVHACVGELTRRPVTTFFMGLLTNLLLPVVLLILIVTGIGVLIVPFVLAALFFGALIGKVAFLEYLGHGVGRAITPSEAMQPLLALLIGSAILVGLYIVPVLGLIAFAVTGLWGLGAAVTAAFGNLRHEARERATPPATPAGSPAPGGLAPMPVAAGSGNVAQGIPGNAAVAPDAGAGGPGGFAASPIQSPPLLAPSGPAPITSVPEALAFPRAGFWERMGAAFLDLVLIGILSGLVGGPPLGYLVALAYFAGMWTWKGTTVGGVVLNMKVVRLDGSPLTFAAALVRGLASAFSVVVMFLGFLWIAWDPEKQGWHDRIAGTVVVRLPRGTPLVCL